MAKIEHAHSALFSLNPGCSRDEWGIIAMASKVAGGDHAS